MILKRIFVVLLLLFQLSQAQSQTLSLIDSGKNSSMRGLSVVNNQVAWISGSNGYTARTLDAGKTWQWNQLSGYEKLDFRDIEAFSDSKAIIVSAGTPAVILKTIDGGKSWKEVYRNNSEEIFLDGMDFWNEKRGIIYGDPIANKMQLLETKDGGESWQNISSNNTIPLMEGEASFAASGTAIRTLKNGKVYIATGGKQSRLFYSSDFGKSWTANKCDIIQGESSTGPFSISFYCKNKGIAVGGDYLKDTLRANNCVLTNNGGKTWLQTEINPFGYRSAVEHISKKILVATGTSGTDISYDGGLTWKNISPEGFNTVRKAKKGKLVLLTGSKGKIARLYF